ncbi:MAG: PD40 domain-containing protein, partial [Myxococcales bacterium]|nr:PD40 domain-containing protein [Myxococcales bacterium]
CAVHALSGPTFENKSQPLDKKNNVMQAAQKIVSANDISGATRLRVEGAAFRAFNFYFPALEVAAGASLAQQKQAQEIRDIIERDFLITGNISLIKLPQEKNPTEALIKQKGAEGLSRIRLSFSKDKLNAEIRHKNLMTQKISQVNISESSKEIRRFSHLIAQSIFEEFIGPENIFLTQIVAVKRYGNESQIVLMDFDGKNEQKITTGSWKKTMPYFAPDGKKIFYTVITKQGQGIVEQEIGKKEFKFLTRNPGINIEPRVLPGDLGLLLTLSLNKADANIYRIDSNGKIIGTFTESLGFNLSPVISPDKKMVAFVSSRSGTPQIYEKAINLNDKKSEAKRMTFQGRYNQTPQYSPDGKYIAFTGRDENKVFDVFLLERSSGRISRVTENQGRNQEPFFFPSGRFLVFSSEREGRTISDLYLAMPYGDHQFRLTTDGGYLSAVVRPKE